MNQTSDEIAEDACHYLFRIGKHLDKSVEFDPAGYIKRRLLEHGKAMSLVEREACAKIADAEAADSWGHSARQAAAEAIAAAIRARGEKE